MAPKRPFSKRQQRLVTFALRHGTHFHTALYRRSGGRVGNRLIFGLRACLLTTTGRKSGLPRTVALIYLMDGDDVIIVASHGALPTDPAWYLNLQADPEVTIRIARDERKYQARTATGDEREDLWRRLLVMYPPYEGYQEKARPREIPVVVCTPR